MLNFLLFVELRETLFAVCHSPVGICHPERSFPVKLTTSAASSGAGERTKTSREIQPSVITIVFIVVERRSLIDSLRLMRSPVRFDSQRHQHEASSFHIRQASRFALKVVISNPSASWRLQVPQQFPRLWGERRIFPDSVGS